MATKVAPAERERATEGLYLDLLKKCLSGLASPREYAALQRPRTLLRRVVWELQRSLFLPLRLELVRRVSFDPHQREEGSDWPAVGETMIGLKRLDNLEFCITDVIRRGVPGDLVETGVWRGGATIFMRAVLEVCGDQDRKVWVADSFEGIPKPNPHQYPADANDQSWKNATLAVSLEEVKQNFERYGLLDDQVRFLPGRFCDSLPTAPIERLAVLRLDGDLYESTINALENFYPRVSIGGYVIVDDYALPSCRSAVEHYRGINNITEELKPIDEWSRYWQRIN